MQEQTIKLEKFSEQIDEESFAQIYDTFITVIYQFIYYKTYHRETAEDLTSQTFLKALEKLHRFNPQKGSMATWLYQIARNLVIDHYRTKKHTLSIHDIWDLAGTHNVEIDLENKEQLQMVQAVLKALPMNQRDIIIMRVWQELPYKEIAEIMGKSEASCKMLFSRTIAYLRENMSIAVVLLIYLLRKPL